MASVQEIKTPSSVPVVFKCYDNLLYGCLCVCFIFRVYVSFTPLTVEFQKILFHPVLRWVKDYMLLAGQQVSRMWIC